ncbi:MAG TPA: carboxypeptidase regulatory-like domain-containing protein [Blastocatellia bacterium]|nr:carboxypeptidase regulatory-like domain-containing protein [Blastocatellia bacterium]
MKSIRKLSLMMILVLVVRVELVFPQASVSTAEIRGQVTDQSGAAVVGATITITDVTKGTTRTVASDEEGNYVILSLLPSTYNIKVEAAGFATKNLTDIRLAVGQVSNVPISLGVGSVDAVVDVTATSDVVEVERTQQSSVINEVQIDNLPINRRNYLDFALLTPGVSDADNINDSSDFRVAQTPQSGLSFGGNNGRGNSILVDGASVDTNSGGARSVVGQEAVQEFQVNRNSYNAEFGGASGGVVNIVSKTGANEFHGSIFGYFRDDRFDARNAFDFAPGDGSPFNRQQYGGSIGGPVFKDKTFFFTAVERLDQEQTTFVNLLNDPRIFDVTPSQNSLFNFLSATPFAPLATALRGSLTTTEANFPGTIRRFEDASGQFPFDTGETVFSARLDHNFSDKDNGYIRFNLGDVNFENSAAGALNATSRGRTIDSFTGGALLSETHFFSPTTINDIKLQYSYLRFNVIPNDPIGPEINIEGFGNFGRDIFLPSRSIERRYEIADNLSLVRGSHTLKLGGQWQAINNSTNSETFFGGRFNFGAAIPLSNIIAAGAGAPTLTALNNFLRSPAGAPFNVDANGNLVADILDQPISALQSFNLNLPIVYQQGFGEASSDAFTYRNAAYIQDTWKVRPNFTLNLGLRYFFEDGPFFQPPDRNNWQPRVGFSWNPDSEGRTVIRGGYGIFTGQVDNQILNVTNELGGFGDPSNIDIVLATATSAALGVPTSIQIYQTLLAQGVIGNRTITESDLAQFGIFPGPGRPLEVRFRITPDFENPYTQQASFAIQRALGDTWSVEASYLFNRGAHITRNRDINQFKRTGPINAFTGRPTFIRFPTPAQAAAGLTSDFRNPFIFQDNVYESTANSFYHAGTIQVIKRFSSRISINTNYTLSKAIDEVTDFNSDWSAQDPLDLRLDRGLSAFDQRHRFVFSGVFQSPFDGDSVTGRVFGNWVLSPIFIAGSGRPFNILLGFDANNDGRSQSDRPFNLGRNTGKGDNYYNFDMRLARRFAFAETKFLELTFEAFNLFNHTNYTGVNNVVGTQRVFGNNITGIEGLAPTQPLAFTSAAPARQLQFGARFNF